MLNVNLPLAFSSLVAIVLHLLLFALLTLAPSPATPKIQKKIAVHTVKLQPQTIPQAEPKASEIAVAQKEPSPASQITKQITKKKKPPPQAEPKASEIEIAQKESLPVPKKNAKQRPKKKKPLPQEKPKPVKAVKKTQNLLAKAQESLKKIETNKTKATIATPAPKLLSQELDAMPSANEIAYSDELIEYLQIILRLPEMGEMNLRLTIAKNGNIKKIEILSSESILNRKYIEKTLPEHTMPPLGKQFGNIDSHTFTITMKGV